MGAVNVYGKFIGFRIHWIRNRSRLMHKMQNAKQKPVAFM